MSAWTAAERHTLGELYRRGTPVARISKILRRRACSVYKQAQALGLQHKRAARPWTAAEDRILRREWGENAWRPLRQKLRGRSRVAIVQRAAAIGLPSVPQGWVSIQAAADHCGMSHATLLCVLQRARIRPRRWYSLSAGGSGVRLYVELDEVVVAVEEEVREWERVPAAAARWSLSPDTLAAWLRRGGVELRAAAARKSVRYARSADVDRIVRERGWRPGRVCLSVAARAVGLGCDALRRRLRLAGLIGAPIRRGADWYVDLEEVRRVVQTGVGMQRRTTPRGVPQAPEVGGRDGRTYAPPRRCA